MPIKPIQFHENEFKIMPNLYTVASKKYVDQNIGQYYFEYVCIASRRLDGRKQFFKTSYDTFSPSCFKDQINKENCISAKNFDKIWSTVIKLHSFLVRSIGNRSGNFPMKFSHAYICRLDN